MAPVAVSTILVVEPACTRTPQYGQVIVFAVISFWEWPSKSILLSLSYLFLLRRLVRTLFQIFIYIIVIFIHKFVFGDFNATNIDLSGDGIGDKAGFQILQPSYYIPNILDCAVDRFLNAMYPIQIYCCSSTGGIAITNFRISVNPML